MRSIRATPHSQRPREKILTQGPEALSIEELLAVILNTGSSKHTVSTVARKVKSTILTRRKDAKDILLSLGIGPFKTAQLMALMEISHRLRAPETIKITKPEQVYALAQEIIHDRRESILCLYLNARGELIHKEVVAVGTLNRAALLPREIFALIKHLPVAGVILAHNHPSGDLTPSRDDMLFTQRVKAAGDILGVSLLDHLVVGKGGWKRIEWR